MVEWLGGEFRFRVITRDRDLGDKYPYQEISGDTLVSVPALHVIREHLPNARLTLLTDFQIGKNYIQARDILDGSGLVDDYLLYPVDVSQTGKILRPI